MLRFCHKKSQKKNHRKMVFNYTVGYSTIYLAAGLAVNSAIFTMTSTAFCILSAGTYSYFP